MFQDIAGRAGLDDFTPVQDKDEVADVLHNGEVMRDEEEGQSKFLLQILEEIHDLCLYADIQRADRFVADEELGFHGKRPGNADPLTLTAAEFVRVPMHHLTFKTDSLEEALNTIRTLGPIKICKMDLKGFPDDFSHGHARIQGAEGILKNILDFPAEGAELLFTHGEDLRSLPESRARSRGNQLDQRSTDGCLAASTLTDQSDCFTGGNGEAHAIHRLERVCFAAQ